MRASEEKRWIIWGNANSLETELGITRCCRRFTLGVQLILATFRERWEAHKSSGTSTMRILEIAIGTILIGGAASTTVRSYKGRGTSSFLVLAFAVFLVGLGLVFLFGAFSAVVRDFRIGSEWIK